MEHRRSGRDWQACGARGLGWNLCETLGVYIASCLESGGTLSLLGWADRSCRGKRKARDADHREDQIPRSLNAYTLDRQYTMEA